VKYRLVLLDVDGTLLLCAGAGRRSLERAVREHCGLYDPGHPERSGGEAAAESKGDLAPLRLDGSTDRLIVRHALKLLGHEMDDSSCDRILARYVEILEPELADPGYHVLPGVAAALGALRDGGVAHGLCTGNVREGARLKLRRGALDGFFEWGPEAVGGFADDGEVRTRIVEAAMRRAAARYGPIPPAEVLVVGDTPLDVQAGHEAGCAVLGVATGRYGKEDLLAAGANHAVETLETPEALRLLLG
jgi:phosphoglycolate phosphatase-like HAD superfamily hydrolase